MRCHICNADVENLPFNRKTKKFEPCGTCRGVARSAAYSDLESTNISAGEVEHILLIDQEEL